MELALAFLLGVTIGKLTSYIDEPFRLLVFE